MTGRPTGDEITEAEWDRADSYLGRELRTNDPEEAWTVLNAVENDEDPVDALVQLRHNLAMATKRRSQVGGRPEWFRGEDELRRFVQPT